MYRVQIYINEHIGSLVKKKWGLKNESFSADMYGLVVLFLTTKDYFY